MNGDGENEILDEVTKGGLPSNVRVELVAERDPVADQAGLIYGEEPAAAPALCGQNYAHNGRVFPEKCSRELGHKPRSSTSNHYCFGIGWWS